MKKEIEKLKVSSFSNIENPRYIPRDLSWLDFNTRVLTLSQDPRVPFFERLKFLAISSSNLDEFLGVRVTSILNDIESGIVHKNSIGGIDTMKEFNDFIKHIRNFKLLQSASYNALLTDLSKRDIHIFKYDELNSKMQGKALKYFKNKVLPTLTPISLETTKEIPLIRSQQMTIVIEASEFQGGNSLFTFIPINKASKRLCCIDKDAKVYMLVEDLVRAFAKYVCNKKKILNVIYMRLIRQADLTVEHSDELHIVGRMHDLLYSREIADPIYVEVSSGCPPHVVKLLKSIYRFSGKILGYGDVMDYSFLMGAFKNKEEVYKKFTPQISKAIDVNKSIMSQIKKEDIMLHHPYDKYDTVLDLLEEAIQDREVVAIRQTLYRVASSDCEIIDRLCRASIRGINVSVMIELRARFDEYQNLELIDKLVKAGCQLTYGLEDYKTHCKLLVIVKEKGDDDVTIFSHISTGNYNEKTAKTYTDVSYFTSNYKIGMDIISVFNYVSGYNEPNLTTGKKVFLSPHTLRDKLEDLIQTEIDNVKRGKQGCITIKVNSVSDKKMIDLLYHAANKGVEIIMIVRGVCSMVPIHKNITIKSIVGRYLEHSRIYHFHNDGKPKYFIASADLLTRNLEKRVELLVAITDSECKAKLAMILKINIKDQANSFIMDASGKYVRPNLDNKPLCQFNTFIRSAKHGLNIPQMPGQKVKIK